MKRRQTALWILLGAALSIHLLFGRNAKPETDVPALLEKGALLIDVRTPQEYAAGHIDGALNIPHDIIGSRISKHESDKNRPIVVYCRSGRRSAIARQTLLDMGYTTVINAGGYQDLKKLLNEGK